MFWKRWLRCGIETALMLAAGVLLLSVRSGRQSDWPPYIVLFAVISLGSLFQNWRILRLMKCQGVDASALQQFRQELECGATQRFDRYVITQHYVARLPESKLELFPLAEIAGLRCGVQRSRRGGTRHHVELLFRNGKTHTHKYQSGLGEKRARELVHLLAQHCPLLRSRVEDKQQYRLDELWPEEQKL